MTYTVTLHLLERATGRRATYRMESFQDSGEEFEPHWYTEGNGGCDCNRSDWFGAAVGEELDDACGDGERFHLEKIVRDDTGQVVYEADA
jgi:hypothetical protein